uniref:Polyadenylate-binding protein RBP45C n=1 Tax=Rhizophora mucronata TaxID=61149 RepID=A0A2P2LSJ9_RHIMU
MLKQCKFQYKRHRNKYYSSPQMQMPECRSGTQRPFYLFPRLTHANTYHLKEKTQTLELEYEKFKLKQT